MSPSAAEISPSSGPAAAKTIAISQLHDFLSGGFPDIFRWTLHRPPTAEELNGNLCSLFNAMFVHFRNTLPANDPSPDCFIFTEPGRPAVTFDELCSRISHFTEVLAQKGSKSSKSGSSKPLAQGDKVLILSSLGVDFFVGSIACLSLGATLILLDPFMERAKMNVCIESVLPISHIVTNMKLTAFKKWILSRAVPALKKIPNVVEIPVNVDKKTLASVPKTIPVISVPGDTTALLSFTTGSTGNPKPIRRSHDYLRAQTIAVFCQKEIKASSAEFPTTAKNSESPSFDSTPAVSSHKPVKAVTNLPVFIFGQIMLGYTTLIPDNFNPAGVSPAPLLQAMIRHNVQVAFGSPAFFLRLLQHLEATGGVDQYGKFINPLPVRVLCLGGAPVFSSELDIMRRGVRGAAFIFYGASEAEPISKIRVEERILLEANPSSAPKTKGSNNKITQFEGPTESESEFEGGNVHALCVGHVNLDGGFSHTAIVPLDGEDVKGQQFLELGHIGEIVVSGPHVHITTTSDDDRIVHELPSEANGNKDRIWLRTGDCGYLDSAQRLWLVGRASWVVRENADDGVEGSLNSLCYWPIAIERSVLETFGASHGVTYVVFMPSGATKKPALFVEAPNGLALAAHTLILEHLQETFDVPVDELHVFRKLPRDKRHASKINTMALSKMIKDKKASDKVVVQRGDITGSANDSLRRGMTSTSLKYSASSLDLNARTTLANAVAPSPIPAEQRFKFSNPEQNHFLFAWHASPLLAQYGGGKAKNMATLTNLVTRVSGVHATVPAWFCVSTEAFKAFLTENQLESQISPHLTTSEGLEAFHAALTAKIMAAPLSRSMTQEITALVGFLTSNSTSASNSQPYFAVRSSGADEDSVSHSFAGQFDSFLYRQSMGDIITALKKCWLSAFAPRVMSHRLACGLPVNNVRMGVVVQIMVDSECAGVAFSRHPLNPISANVSLVEAVWGQGEALVSGAAEPDSFEVERGFQGKIKETLVPKPKMWVRNGGGADGEDATGLIAVDVPEPKSSAAALTHDRARAVGATVSGLEALIGTPVDFEWAFQEEDSMLYCLQVRPIVNLPPAAFFFATDPAPKSEASTETLGESHISIQSTTSAADTKSKSKGDDIDFSSIANRALESLAAPQGMNVTLWDNSNIVESYSGVTTPLTFSFASYNYRIVYETMLTFLGTPTKLVQANEDALINLLGYIRGNVYYNLMNWYRLLLLAPLGKFSDPKHMETMMGVKQGQEGNADMEKEFKKILDARPKFNAWHRTNLVLKYISAYRNIDRIVNKFFANFDAFYSAGREMDFTSMSLEEIALYYKKNASTLLRDWKAPVINDLLVMGFFGTLKSFIAKHLVDAKATPAAGGAVPTAAEAAAAAADTAAVDSLQNDLLCGEDVESAKPTKMLMEIAKTIDSTIEYPGLGAWFIGHKDEILKAIKPEENHWILRSTILKLSFVKASELLAGLQITEADKPQPPVQVVADVLAMILEFLDSYGFRCINELKLEEKDLNDDPDFVINAVAGYVRTKAYEVDDLDKREQAIRAAAEALVHQKLKGTQLKLFLWLLRNTRRVVKHRENLRFARSKVFGVMRRIFRGMGHRLVALGALDSEQDVFYLTTEELLSYVDGRAVSRDLKALTQLRKTEFDGYAADANAPPERFVTRGAAGVYMWYPHILADLDLLKDAEDSNGPPEPGILKGVSCCPGIVEGVVRVAKDISETKDLDGEILVTARTDPGWVPLYPMCSGLLIERGSLLSHSAVVARELGLPTIVGISGGLMKRLKTGMRVRMDAGKGKVYILDELEALEKEGAAAAANASGDALAEVEAEGTPVAV
ncbi:MAG: pyruvate phosphate dikinase [Linnemannia gamsii]|nr:MAG: pyruvate phosphate dikinase [Linnemannia gamsii]